MLAVRSRERSVRFGVVVQALALSKDAIFMPYVKYDFFVVYNILHFLTFLSYSEALCNSIESEGAQLFTEAAEQ